MARNGIYVGLKYVEATTHFQITHGSKKIRIICKVFETKMKIAYLILWNAATRLLKQCLDENLWL